ncbi:MAG: hypothetical protein K0R08_334 [Solimicrobium sp.]|jgi:hypothetical protein|nr:hypothetical protein [Solimicrobium sp.]
MAVIFVEIPLHFLDIFTDLPKAYYMMTTETPEITNKQFEGRGAAACSLGNASKHKWCTH